MLLSVQSVAYAVDIGQLHVQKKPRLWRFTFSANQPIKHHTLHLQNPPRVAIDIPYGHLLQPFRYSDYAQTPVKQIRIGRPKSSVMRLVFDLAYPLSVRTYTVRPNQAHSYQLVVELIGSVPDAALAIDSDPSLSRLDTVTQLPPPTLPASLPRSNRKVVVALDPGHGGKDPGATGRRGTHEKKVVLLLARQIQHEINRLPGFKAVLTRKGDYYVPLRKRLALAREYKADMFVSVHADAYHDRQARGASVYALSERGATSEAARWLAQQENASELMGGVDLSDKNNVLKSVLINLSQTAAIRASLEIGQNIIRFLARFTPLHYSRVGQAAFVVLKSPDVPSILVESGFITNLHEERNLNNSRYREKLARAITAGVSDYFQRNPPRGTWLAQRRSR